MRRHTVAAEGGAAGVIKDNDSFDNHFNDTVAGGDRRVSVCLWL